MASLRASFGDLLEPTFRKIFDDRYSEIPEVFPSIFHVNTSEKQEEHDSAVTGFGLLQLTGEGQNIDYDDPVQMYDKTYSHLKYTKGFKVSQELWEDDQYNVMNKKPSALARAARRTVEYQASRIFVRAFTSTQVGGDSEELCSTSHDRSDGGTAQSNASATGIVLTEPNLETGILALRGQLDDRGQLIMTKADKLIVPPALRKEAMIITGSNLRSGTADNDINVDKGLSVVDWDYIGAVAGGSDTAWFLLDSSLHELNWFWRVRPEFKQDHSFETDMALFKARTRFSVGFSDWRGVWGSAGDGAAYSG